MLAAEVLFFRNTTNISILACSRVTVCGIARRSVIAWEEDGGGRGKGEDGANVLVT